MFCFLVGCASASNAPRPIPDSPTERWRSGGDDVTPMNDDDNDGIPNSSDNCPLAREDWSDPVKDGCPTAIDAGMMMLNDAR